MKNSVAERIGGNTADRAGVATCREHHTVTRGRSQKQRAPPN